MNKDTSILAHCTSGGCGAKIDPTSLSNLLNKLPHYQDDNLIVGYESSDDAAIYKIDEFKSIVSTTDFFSPMIDDPFVFGKIAAANALSDIYAMGGTCLTALNIVCFPEALDLEILEQILIGGALKVQEACATLAGGHSIYDKEIKYGLAVTGIINNDKILLNNTPQVGDQLILTKPLGVGIMMAGHRANLVNETDLKTVTDQMERLNKYAAEKMLNYQVNACTDITGFGLLAHLLEMLDNNVSLELNTKTIPYHQCAYDLASEYIITAAGQRNRNHVSSLVNVDQLSFPLQELLFDPQTSGGLLISVTANDAQSLLKDIQKDDPNAQIIGTILHKETNLIKFI